MKIIMVLKLSIVLLIFNTSFAYADSACGGTVKEPCECNQRLDSATHQCYVDKSQCNTKCSNKTSQAAKKPAATSDLKKKKNKYY